MYVSDEEDKPEMLLISPPVEDFEHHHIDTDDARHALHFGVIEEHSVTFSSKAKKRPRMHFSPPPPV